LNSAESAQDIGAFWRLVEPLTGFSVEEDLAAFRSPEELHILCRQAIILV